MQNVRKGSKRPSTDTAFGWPRDFLGNRFIYAVISQRARGLSIGVNLNPEKYCNFDCVYCEVQRGQAAARNRPVDLGVMSAELTKMLELAGQNQLREQPRFRTISRRNCCSSRRWRSVATANRRCAPILTRRWRQCCGCVRNGRQFFKIVLITNTAGLFLPQVQRGWRQLSLEDEIWLKLDAGTQKHMKRVNRPDHVTLKNVMANILRIGRERPVVIQSLFPMLDGEEPDEQEIDAYVHRLQELMAGWRANLPWCKSTPRIVRPRIPAAVTCP